MKRAIAVVLVAVVAGCVDGSPVEPAYCTVYADSSYVVTITAKTVANCPSNVIHTSVVK